jgi:hypothetical protein
MMIARKWFFLVLLVLTGWAAEHALADHQTWWEPVPGNPNMEREVAISSKGKVHLTGNTRAVQPKDDSTPLERSTPQPTVSTATPETQESPERGSEKDRSESNEKPNGEFVKGVVEKVLDELGSIAGIKLGTMLELSGAKNEQEAGDTLAESIVSDVLEKVIPGLDLISLALTSTPTASDDTLYPASPTPSSSKDKNSNDRTGNRP